MRAARGAATWLAAAALAGGLLADPVVARERMAYPILVDARNALDAEAFGRAGFTVIGVGRPVRNALTPAWR